MGFTQNIGSVSLDILYYGGLRYLLYSAANLCEMLELRFYFPGLVYRESRYVWSIKHRYLAPMDIPNMDIMASIALSCIKAVYWSRCALWKHRYIYLRVKETITSVETLLIGTVT